MSLVKLIFGAVVGIALCIAIILFATKKHVPAIVLVVCAVIGAITLWKWSLLSDLASSGRTRMGDMYGVMNQQRWQNNNNNNTFDETDLDWAQ